MGPAHGHATGPSHPEGHVHVVTDLEGRRDALDDLVHAGLLQLRNGELDFVSPDDGLYFAGDVCDRGPWSIRLVDMLLSLHRRHPGRVAWCYGNLDLKNLALLRDLPRLAESPDYAAWRSDRDDTLDCRVDFWLRRQGATRAFEFHQSERAQILGRPVPRLEAAEDYVARLRPGGAMFEFLRLGRIAIVHGRVLIDHGGVSAANIGFVPGASARFADARAWIDALNAYAADQIRRIEHAVTADGAAFPDAFIRYGDAIWDPAARAGSGALYMHDISLVYPFRQREQGNFRVPDDAAIRYLRDAGIDTEIVGHSPFGDVPGPLRAGGFLRLMADTSHRREGVRSTITIDRLGALHVRARTVDGNTVAYRVAADNASPIGCVTREDGFTVVARGRVGGRTHFLLTKYFGGYNIRDRWVDRAHLDAMRPEAAVASCESDEPRRHHEVLVAELQRKGKRILALEEVEALIGGRTPIVVSGFSHFGHAPFAEACVDAEAQALVAQIAPPSQEILITGGTDVGFERAVHRAARASGHLVVGFIQRGALAGEIDLVDDLSFAGAYRDWSAPLLAALSFAASRGGCAIFVGGGPTVGAGIEHARQLGMPFFLVGRAPGVQGDGGASAQAADRLAEPERARCVLRSLQDLAMARRARVAVQAGPARVALFAGSFDPPHVGHRDLVLRMRQRFGLDLVFIVPDGVRHYKAMQALEHRVRMTTLLLQDVEGVQVMSPDADPRFGTGELWELLDGLRQMHPAARCFAIVGSDTLRWIAGQPPAQRPLGVTWLVNDRHDGPPLPPSLDGQPLQVVDDLDQGLSSTAIRAALRAGQPPRGLTPDVANYMDAHQLYRQGNAERKPQAREGARS